MDKLLLITIVDKYLENAFLIDFHKFSNRYKNKFLGCVDLSIEGVFKLLSETPALATVQQNWQVESRKELAG